MPEGAVVYSRYGCIPLITFLVAIAMNDLLTLPLISPKSCALVQFIYLMGGPSGIVLVRMFLTGFSLFLAFGLTNLAFRSIWDDLDSIIIGVIVIPIIFASIIILISHLMTPFRKKGLSHLYLVASQTIASLPKPCVILPKLNMNFNVIPPSLMGKIDLSKFKNLSQMKGANKMSSSQLNKNGLGNLNQNDLDLLSEYASSTKLDSSKIPKDVNLDASKIPKSKGLDASKIPSSKQITTLKPNT